MRLLKFFQKRYTLSIDLNSVNKIENILLNLRCGVKEEDLSEREKVLLEEYRKEPYKGLLDFPEELLKEDLSEKEFQEFLNYKQSK